MGHLLCLDRGNSGLKAALFEGDQLVDRPDFTGDLKAALDALPLELEVAISSVAPSRDEALLDDLQRRGRPVWRLTGDSEVPFPIDVTGRETLGADRLANAAAAWFQRRYPVVVVDAGSAVTLDLVDGEGRYRGGFILPGEALWLRTMAEGGELLPEIPREGAPFPGLDTAGALRGGAAWGLAEAVQGLCERLGDLLEQPVSVILTGGGAGDLAGRWRGESPPVERDWTLLGLRDLHRWIKEPHP